MAEEVYDTRNVVSPVCKIAYSFLCSSVYLIVILFSVFFTFLHVFPPEKKLNEKCSVLFTHAALRLYLDNVHSLSMSS